MYKSGFVAKVLNLVYLYYIVKSVNLTIKSCYIILMTTCGARNLL